MRSAERKLKLLQQRVTRKRIGSNNRKKASEKVALLHEDVANCRKDWHRQLSHRFRLHGDDKVKVNNCTFPDGRRTTPDSPSRTV
ncbi:hypothetical protein Q5692_15350 [Microcoleus sp. C2C3]|uniref:hypothetical protein n=1 Tax=unclassified Microcoleus TaxID=2642155 RepID=UPI002FD02ECF